MRGQYRSKKNYVGVTKKTHGVLIEMLVEVGRRIPLSV
jgi:hypothetical protein